MFGLVSGQILLKRRFPTAAAARAWGEWNARGRGSYVVVPIKPDGTVELPPKQAALKPGDCTCDRNESDGRKIWTCPIHGNVAA